MRLAVLGGKGWDGLVWPGWVRQRQPCRAGPPSPPLTTLPPPQKTHTPHPGFTHRVVGAARVVHLHSTDGSVEAGSLRGAGQGSSRFRRASSSSPSRGLCCAVLVAPQAQQPLARPSTCQAAPPNQQQQQSLAPLVSPPWCAAARALTCAGAAWVLRWREGRRGLPLPPQCLGAGGAPVADPLYSTGPCLKDRGGRGAWV